MGSYRLSDPHIEKVIINGQQTECVMSMASNVSNYWDNNFVESTDKLLIEALRSYIVKEKGGDKMVYKCGEKPGIGRYICTKCGAPKNLDDSTDTLAPCSRCRNCTFNKV